MLPSCIPEGIEWFCQKFFSSLGFVFVKRQFVVLELVNCLSSHRALDLFLHFWKSLQYPELFLMAACARAGTWDLGRVVSLELRWKEFFGEAGFSGCLAA